MANTKKHWRKINVDNETDFANDEELRQKVLSQDNLVVFDTKGRSSSKKRPRLDIKHEKGSSAPFSRPHGGKIHKKVAALTRRKKSAEGAFDLWGSDVTVSSDGRKKSSSVRTRRTIAPAIKPPHPGQSINPDPKSHLDLLESEAAKVVEEQRIRKEIASKERPLTHKLSQLIPKREARAMTLCEKQQALRRLTTGASSDIEEKQTVNDTANEILKRKMPEKKSKGTRNREKRHAARLEKTRNIRAGKQFLHSIDRTRSILREMRLRRITLQQRQLYRLALRAQIKEEERQGIVQLKTGANVFREAPEGVSLRDEIKLSGGSLRKTHIPPGSSPATDRFKSVQRRGLVELKAELTVERQAKKVVQQQKMRKKWKYINGMMRDAEKDAGQRVRKSQGGMLTQY